MSSVNSLYIGSDKFCHQMSLVCTKNINRKGLIRKRKLLIVTVYITYRMCVYCVYLIHIYKYIHTVYILHVFACIYLCNLYYIIYYIVFLLNIYIHVCVFILKHSKCIYNKLLFWMRQITINRCPALESTHTVNYCVKFWQWIHSHEINSKITNINSTHYTLSTHIHLF